ncbi:hypothetical protein L202_08114 [Cryptococcus amylolentus CBS 6039]|uniref:D-isomer specific 2-hydroxyacid dehydrogenase NAD-binding domain-containing protein n=1 Tax=Cryptococcus amylolentus CBS 6039 TaxID=1295533 RepID=A0A1E3H8R1_9TREE|nr:hypothetical protein L202_08114 [Cryptococcus amylolentus CBS 6039]ODN72674.1 hypothetical protein L202_08114 [Cryptococcus amylolentus CBS 6039]
MTNTHPQLDILGLTVALSPEKLAELKTHFKHVYYYPLDGTEELPKEAAAEVDVWYCNWLGIPEYIKYEDVPNLKLVQLTSAGAALALKSSVLSGKEAQKNIIISSASGIHSTTIPQWIIAQIITLYQQLHLQNFNHRTNQVWTRNIPQLPEYHTQGFGRSLYGKTAGLLGYGHIARETARLLKAFNVNVIAANSKGDKRVDDGYIIPGTGDVEGDIPSAYYSTTDKESFKTFLGKSDILIASLPSTPQTQWLLGEEEFALLPPGAIFINVGRGDLVKSETILSALSSSHLSGAALDVTDPEPLPPQHPLYTHPRVVVTAHTSSSMEGFGYYDAGADLLINNVRRVREGGRGKAINQVDVEKGY